MRRVLSNQETPSHCERMCVMGRDPMPLSAPLATAMTGPLPPAALERAREYFAYVITCGRARDVSARRAIIGIAST